MPKKTASIKFNVIYISSPATGEKELSGGAPVYCDSKHIYVGQDANWRWSIKKQIKDIELSRNAMILSCDRSVRVECQYPDDNDWNDFRTTVERHWNKAKMKQQEEVTKDDSTATNWQPKRQRRVYGKHGRKKTMPYTSVTRRWENFSDDEDDYGTSRRTGTESKYFSKNKSSRASIVEKENVQEVVDVDDDEEEMFADEGYPDPDAMLSDENVEQEEMERAILESAIKESARMAKKQQKVESIDSDTDMEEEAPIFSKKRKRTMKRRALFHDDDSDEEDIQEVTTTTTDLVEATNVVSPPQPEGTPATAAKKDDPQSETSTQRITNFFAPQTKKNKGPSTAPKSPVPRPQLSPFAKQEEPKPVSKDRPASLTQDTTWLEQPRPSTPTPDIDAALSDDDTIVTTPRPSTPPPPPLQENRMTSYLSAPRTPTRRRKFHSKPRLSKADEALLGTSTPHRRSLVLTSTPHHSRTKHYSKRPPLLRSKPSSLAAKKVSTTPYRGLLNLGNTCYLNASVQSLYSIPGFVKKLHEVVVKEATSEERNSEKSAAAESKNSYTRLAPEEENKDGTPTKSAAEEENKKEKDPALAEENEEDTPTKLPLASSLDAIFQQLSLTNNQNPISVDPAPLKAAMDSLTRKFEGAQQRDAHEFMAELVDRLHEELPCDVLDEFFRLTVKVSLKCDACGYSRSKDEMYRHLSIDVVQAEDGTSSVQRGLDQFFKPEVREIKCEKCEAGKTATQTQTVVSQPKALLLHLKRFVLVQRPRISAKPAAPTDKDEEKGEEEKENQPPAPMMEMTFQKTRARVQIPESVSLSSYTNQEESPSQQDSQEQPFHLKSIVHHIGSTAFSGHYTADALRGGSEEREEWINFDDTCSTSVSKEQRNEATAYMLLYG